MTSSVTQPGSSRGAGTAPELLAIPMAASKRVDIYSGIAGRPASSGPPGSALRGARAPLSW